MAESSTINHVSAYVSGILVAASGLLAQADPDLSTSQIGKIGVFGGIAWILIQLIRETKQPFLKGLEMSLENREDRIRMQAAIEHFEAENGKLRAELEKTKLEADTARELASHAKARADELERTVHRVKTSSDSNAKEVSHASHRLDVIEPLVLGPKSGEIPTTKPDGETK